MFYFGGKNKMLAAHGMGDFWRTYLASMQVKRFVDVCCGSGAVSSFIGKERPDIALVCNDVHPAVVALLRGVAREGWVPPTTLTEAEYINLRNASRRGEVSPLIGFAGFGCSFGGKFFRGYARGAITRNYAGAAAKALLKDAPHLARADFYNLDYAALVDAVGVREGDVWYIDPPYAGTEKYGGTGGEFDHARFWGWAVTLSRTTPVLVSEFSAPSDWHSQWSVTRKQEMRTRGGERSDRTDRIFVYPDALRASRS